MSASMIEFGANGSTAGGYLAVPSGGSGPGLIVLQEWWGLVPQIKSVCDRLAAEGFTALAPDLYHGEMAEHTEMDRAGELMTTLPPDRAARDMTGAIDHLLSLDACNSATVGVVGFCMGGMLSLVIAAQAGDKVSTVAPFYGAPLDGTTDWTALSARVEGHFAGIDDFFPPEAVQALEAELQAMGKNVVFHIYEGAGHGFSNEENPLGTFNDEATATSWGRMLELMRTGVV